MAEWSYRAAHVDMGLTVAVDVASFTRWPFQLYLERLGTVTAVCPGRPLLTFTASTIPLIQPFHGLSVFIPKTG